jgi:ketosteroid isomerase-like protein
MDQLQTVQQIYQAFGRGDVPAILEHFVDDIEWEHDAMDHGIPWLVPGRGKAHVLSFFEAIGRDLDISGFEVQSLLSGQNQVVAIVRIEATVRPTGKRFGDLELHLWTFDARGKVVKFRHVVDTHQHWAASRR